MTRSLLISALLVPLCSACFIPYGGDLQNPHWSADGKEIFYLEQRFLSGPHPDEYFRLWRARPDLRGRTKLGSGEHSHQPQPSAGGRYLLFDDHPTLIVYDLERRRRVWSETFERMGNGILKGWGWADRQTIFLTDGSGLRLVSIPDGGSTSVSANRYRTGLAGSSDGRHLLFQSGRHLMLFDRASGESRAIASASSSKFGPAYFTSGNQQIVYFRQTVGTRPPRPEPRPTARPADLMLFDLVSGDSRKIWEREVWVKRMEPSRDEQLIIFSGSEEIVGVSSLFCIGIDGSEHRIPGRTWNMQWDYDPTSDRIISAEGEETLQIRSLAELGCTD